MLVSSAVDVEASPPGWLLSKLAVEGNYALAARVQKPRGLGFRVYGGLGFWGL